MEVGSLSRGVMSQLLSAPLQGSLRFFHPPLPAALSARLAESFPIRESYGLTTFYEKQPSRLGLASPPVAQCLRQER
jgi:hypothetical protein